MLLRQHAGSQGLSRVAGQHGHHCLVEYLAVVQFCGDPVHSGTGKLAPLVDGPLMGVQTSESRQQAGMDVHQPPVIVRHKRRCEDAHEPCQHHQRGVEVVYLRHQRGIKGFTAGVTCVIDQGGAQALLPCPGDTRGLGLVADDCHHAGSQALLPVISMCGFHEGCHVGTAAGDQNHDVFHFARHSVF